MPRRKNITEEKKDDLKNEVKYLATAAVGILLLLTVFLNNSMGPVGVFVRNFLVGFFGFGAFVLPAGILIVSVFKLISREIKLPIVKIIFLFWFILSLLHIFIYKADENLFIFSDVYKQGLDSGGGIFGVLIGGLAEFLLGTVGATIALVSGVIILAVMITKRSLIQIVESVAGKIREYYVESRRYEEEAEREFKNREREKIIPLR
ncbi:MAG: DNA translocase FtsK 4TM domain-containing protein, partial [Defluviitaleaceae bacterium]|nr:DNA translocase FtsK 4TM domain-containing protein [Defluviitaleaceae bacterium]